MPKAIDDSLKGARRLRRGLRPTPRQQELNGFGIAWLPAFLAAGKYGADCVASIRPRVQIDIGDHFVDKLYAKLATRRHVTRQKQRDLPSFVRNRPNTSGSVLARAAAIRAPPS